MLTLKVETRPGDEIGTVSRGVCALANRIGVNVETVYRGCRLLAEPNADPSDLIAAWENERGQDNRFALAIARTKAD